MNNWIVMNRALYCLVFVGSLLFAGCGQDLTKFYDENVAIKEAFTTALKPITDAESAESAMPVLETLADRYKAWEASINGVVFTIEDYRKHKDRIVPAKDALKTELQRVKVALNDHPELKNKIADFCKGPLSQ